MHFVHSSNLVLLTCDVLRNLLMISRWRILSIVGIDLLINIMCVLFGFVYLGRFRLFCCIFEEIVQLSQKKERR
jgi:hypothetical protein